MNNEAAIGIPELASDESWLRQQALKWNRDVKFLIRETRVLSLLLRHPDAPWRAKVVAACTVGYLLSPIQIIPTFIPLIGQLGSPHRNEVAAPARAHSGAGRVRGEG